MSNHIEVKCSGKVYSWNNERGFGFLEISSIGRIYTHVSCLVDRKELKPGEKVTCKLGQSEKGMIAREVIVNA